MLYFTDLNGVLIRLTEERVEHILRHRERVGIIEHVGDVLANPDFVEFDQFDPEVSLYIKLVEHQYICVVVKLVGNDAFILTCYAKRRLPDRSM